MIQAANYSQFTQQKAAYRPSAAQHFAGHNQYQTQFYQLPDGSIIEVPSQRNTTGANNTSEHDAPDQEQKKSSWFSLKTLFKGALLAGAAFLGYKYLWPLLKETSLVKGISKIQTVGNICQKVGNVGNAVKRGVKSVASFLRLDKLGSFLGGLVKKATP
ncbi:MAG: hypothetical protein K2X66_17115 [Cyanobacteria bacterium]|nr:hypothetical protein [Cyanobacteriota bacterium]